MAKKHNVLCCGTWDKPKSQAQKLVEGEGSSLSDGLAASVPMYGDDAFDDGRYDGFGPRPHRKTEKPV